MRIPRLHVDTPLSPPSCTLDEQATHYLSRVLRLRSGDVVDLFDGCGGHFRAHLEALEKKHCTLSLDAPLPESAESSLTTRLGLSLQRGERMDFAVQKATELGATHIDLLITERVEVKLADKRLANRLAHWQGVMVHAAQQSGRTRLPTLAEPCTLEAWIARLPAEGRRLVMDTEGAVLSRDPAPSAATLVTGPEGGLAEHEIAALVAGGFDAVQMGPRILRSETAPVVGLTLMQLLWGDFAGA